MILDPGLASGIVGATGATVLAWGATVSARSAGVGPEWAVAFLARSRRVWLGVAGLGLVTFVVVEPRWLGLTVLYIAWVARWVAGRVSTGLTEALMLGPYLAPSPERRLSIVYRTVLGLVVVAAMAAAIGLLLTRLRGDLAVVALVVAGLLGGLAWRLWLVGVEGVGRARPTAGAVSDIHD